jgi:hypothetical protein
LFVKCPWLSHDPSPIPEPPHAFLTPQVHKTREHTLVYILLQLWESTKCLPLILSYKPKDMSFKYLNVMFT